jgi:Helix-hairpin-helix motif
MIDPYALQGRWTRNRLEEWILFGICVANKPADPTAVKVDAVLKSIYATLEAAGYPSLLRKLPSYTPFELVRVAIYLGLLRSVLEKHRVGQYTRIERAFREVVAKIPNAMQTSVAELETVNGIGPKTARMIMLYYKPETACVPLDTHILKWLRAQGYDAPVGTPSGKKYLELEAIFVKEAAKRRMSVKDLDTKVWKMYALPQKNSKVKKAKAGN